MHLSPSVLLGLAPLAAAAAATTPFSEWTALCIRSQTPTITDLARCGDPTEFAECLNKVPESFSSEDVASCLAVSGCSDDLAAVGAQTIVDLCESVQDLRKRDDDEDEKRAAEPRQKWETPQPTPRAVSPNPVVAPRQETTTSASAKPSDDACYSTSVISTKLCSMVDSHITCSDTTINKISCRKELLCRINAQGGTACMERVDSLDTGGIIVSIVFGSAIAIALGLLIFCCCRERRQHKKLAAKAEAAAIAKASSVGKRARNVSDRQPLMTQAPPSPGGSNSGAAGGYGGGAGGYGPDAGHGGYDAQQPNPFGDQTRY
ncbi:uncharacterized protein DNG_06763 [Cephalotrichum gorgonifer]|uniref:Uncharacterized protein n=1 Tax=Cephalotrichum gorgonifer TaxID=2041049 RepID=A0AAE8SWR5_9PEZI|nr:uncharacterized protein DNG_06763 [Cephalotrichum gorgonifer]